MLIKKPKSNSLVNKFSYEFTPKIFFYFKGFLIMNNLIICFQNLLYCYSYQYMYGHYYERGSTVNNSYITSGKICTY